MLELLFVICLLGVFGRLFLLGIKAAWGISKILFIVLFLPVLLIGMVVGGVMYLAFPILFFIGIVFGKSARY